MAGKCEVDMPSMQLALLLVLVQNEKYYTEEVILISTYQLPPSETNCNFSMLHVGT